MKSVFATFGIILFISAAVTGLRLYNGTSKALTLDDNKTIYAVEGEDTPPHCSWDVTQPERVMSEDKSQAIIITTNNPGNENCEAYLSLQAPGFDMSPTSDEQKVVLAPEEKGSHSWILTPRKTGTFQIAVTDIINTRIFGVTVTDIYGLNAGQAKLLSIIGSLFGPMFTVPWWIEKWRQQKQTRKNKPE